MALLKWNDSYSVQIPSIDAQHKKLLSIINELHQSMVDKKTKETIEKILNDLIEYTKEHFSYEENLLQTVGYADIEEHKDTHQKFIDEVNTFFERHKKGELFLSIDIVDFLINWLLNHIKGTDKKYSKIMLENGIK